MVARFLANPKENHIMAIKRIVRYLKGTADYGLWYKMGGNLDLKVFTNVDWVGSIDEKEKEKWRSILSWQETCVLDKKETKLHFLVHYRGKICCSSSQLFCSNNYW